MIYNKNDSNNDDNNNNNDGNNINNIKTTEDFDRSITFIIFFLHVYFLDLNFSRKLNLNEEYLFVGKRTPGGKLENHVFTANRGTVEPWTQAKNRLITTFNFDTKCKSS